MMRLIRLPDMSCSFESILPRIDQPRAHHAPLLAPLLPRSTPPISVHSTSPRPGIATLAGARWPPCRILVRWSGYVSDALRANPDRQRHLLHARSGGHQVPLAPSRRAPKTRKETMNDIWRSPVLKPKSAARSGRELLPTPRTLFHITPHT